MVDATDIAAQLAALRAQCVARLRTSLDELVQLVQSLERSIPRATLERAHVQLHQMAGAGTTFGYPELSKQAAALEVQVAGWLDANSQPLPSDWGSWRDKVLTLRETLSQPVEAAPVAPIAEVPVSPVRVVLIDGDLAQGEELCRDLSQYDYDCVHFADIAAARVSILTEPPAVLVLDIALAGEAALASFAAVAALFEDLGQRIPTIYLTESPHFATRMSVAAAGGGAHLVKPIHVPSVAGCIEELLQVRRQEPYRVLIVDDDELLAQHYCLTLGAAGLLAEKVCDPMQVLEAMQRFNPDLVLLDLYMPECSGVEVARAIRYDHAWQSLPILCLSAEGNSQRHLEALDSGVDDFLTKPMPDHRIVSMVKARVARARAVADLMSKDGLTGLLTHSGFKERLAQEVARARRYSVPVSVVMLDIDHFKRVNDTHGHPVGDQVIKSMAHLLRQRLRRQDSIGRYGGEEFVAVLPHCTGEDASRMLDDIRQRFGAIAFAYNGESFSVTVSVGIACSADWPLSDDLLEESDKALYAAKAGGRDHVHIAVAPAPPPGL